MFNEREQAQFEHVQYVHSRLLALKSSKREPFAVFVIVAALIYWGTEIIGVSIAIGWIAAMIRGVADETKRTYLLTEFNRAMCDFEGDLEELQRKLKVVLEVERVSALPFWRRWLF
jgi:hypothetical protein